MAMDNRFIDDLKSRIDIVEIIGREVSLKKAGSGYKGLCPFHQEKTPSFSVSEQHQYFHCFGCGEKGDAITFVRKFYHLEFQEAVEKICGDYNIPMPEQGGGPKIDYDRYYEINRKAAKFFFDNMKIAGSPGYRYIRQRGLTDDTIRKFGIGYARNEWHALKDHLLQEGVSEADLLKLGLIQQGKKGTYDKFRNRVIFPIFNTNGKVIGFGGRSIDGGMPKYLNSSESEIFLKKNNLYGLNFTKKDIASEDQVLLVEGYMDMVSLYQSGVKQVAASLGTALTENQARLVGRYTKNVILSYDADNAGVNAALRGIDIMQTAGCNVRILRIDDGKDPDEYVRKHGREDFLKLIRNAVPAVDFRLEIAKRGLDFSKDLDVLAYIRRCVPVLSGLSPVEQNLYIRKLAEEYHLSEMAIASEVRAAGTKTAPALSERPRTERNAIRRGNTGSQAGLRLELSMILLILANDEYIGRLEGDHFTFRSGLGKKCYTLLARMAEDGTNRAAGWNERALFEQLDPEEEAVLRKAIQTIRIGPEEEEFYKECITRYRLERCQLQKTELLSELQVAEKMADEQEMQRIAEKLMQTEQLIRKLRGR